MMLSLTTPKRRVVASDGTIFFNDFNDTLHVDLDGVQEPVALNLGTSNWTVSDAAEVAFLFHADGIPCLAIVDPRRHTRLIQPLSQHKLLNLLLLKDRFVAAIPGYLLVGRRDDRGALSWQGMRALDCGAGFQFQLEDSGLLSYTKRGSCLRFFCDLDNRGTTSAFDPQLLRTILFRQSFAPAYLPELTEEDCTPPRLLSIFRDAAAHHGATDAGLRLFALLSLLEQQGWRDRDTLPDLVALDWELQYSSGLDQPFPTMPLLRRLMQASDPVQLRPGRLIQTQLLKWSRKFEDGTVIGRWAKPLNRVPYSDIIIEG